MDGKMSKSKKGVRDDAGFWISRIILIVMVVFVTVFFVNSIIRANIDTVSLELDSLAARIINSPYCVAKADAIDGITR